MGNRHEIGKISYIFETYTNPDLTIKDLNTFDEFFKVFNATLEEEFSLGADHHRYNGSTKNDIQKALKGSPNAFTIRVAWDVTLRNDRRIAIVSALAQLMHEHFDKGNSLPDEAELKGKGSGY